MIGWKDEQGVYLLSRVLAVAAAIACWGRGIPVSNQAFSQLEGLGAIADKGKDHTAKVIKVGQKQASRASVASALTLRLKPSRKRLDSDAVTKGYRSGYRKLPKISNRIAMSLSGSYRSYRSYRFLE